MNYDASGFYFLISLGMLAVGVLTLVAFFFACLNLSQIKSCLARMEAHERDASNEVVVLTRALAEHAEFQSKALKIIGEHITRETVPPISSKGEGIFKA